MSAGGTSAAVEALRCQLRIEEYERLLAAERAAREVLGAEGFEPAPPAPSRPPPAGRPPAAAAPRRAARVLDMAQSASPRTGP